MWGRPKWTPVNVKHPRENAPVRIVAEGAIAGSGVAEGKLIPVLILDTSERPDIDELVRVHEHLPSGDVGIQWCKLKGTKDSVALVMTFVRPSEITVVVNFELRLHGGSVDLILASRALYLQPGKDGDRLSTGVKNKKILCEAPDTGFGEYWKRIRHEFLVKEFRGRGLTKREAKAAAATVVEEFGKLLDFRMPSASGAGTPASSAATIAPEQRATPPPRPARTDSGKGR